MACKTHVLSNDKVCILTFLASFAAHLRRIGVLDEEKEICFRSCSCDRSNRSVPSHRACRSRPDSTNLDVRRDGIRPRPYLSGPMTQPHLHRPYHIDLHSITCRWEHLFHTGREPPWILARSMALSGQLDEAIESRPSERIATFSNIERYSLR